MYFGALMWTVINVKSQYIHTSFLYYSLHNLFKLNVDLYYA